MKKQKKCLTCDEMIEVDSFARYPRKYCKKCSEKSKKLWAQQWKVKFDELEDE